MCRSLAPCPAEFWIERIRRRHRRAPGVTTRRRNVAWASSLCRGSTGHGHPRLHLALPGPELIVGCGMPRSVLIAGCGFVGLPLARSFVSAGWETAGLTVSETSAASLQGEPFSAHALDITEKESFKRLARRRFDVVI